MRVLLQWLAVLLMLSACSSLDLEEAKQLGADGQEAAAAFHDDTIAVQRQAASAVDYLTLIREINSLPSAIDDETRAQYDRLTELLAARLQVYEELGTLYGSFGDLAAFETAAAMQQAADDFIGTANNFIALADKLGAASPIGPISDGAQAITTVALTAAGTEAQKKRVKEASRVTAAALRKVVQAVEAEQAYAISLREGLALQRANLAETLYTAELATLRPMVAEIAADIGTVPSDDIDARLASNPAAKAAFLNLAKRRAERQVALIDASYRAQIGLLRSLIAQHDKLEAGQPLDLQQIRKWIGQLEQLAQAAGAF